MKTPAVSIARLREVIAYDPSTGLFRWLVDIGTRARAGALAGSLDHRGFRIIRVDRQNLRAVRVAWALTHGVWPTGHIVPMDRDHDNTRLTNLRLATKSEVQGHGRMQRINKVRVKGVTRHGNRFVAKIVKDGAPHYLGTFATAKQANAAYAGAAKVLFGPFARAA